MNNEQCQAIIDAIKDLTTAVYEGTERIAANIDNIYVPSIRIEGIEKRLRELIDALYETH